MKHLFSIIALVGTIYLSLFSNQAFAQNTISVSFRNGAIGTKGGNVRELLSSTNFSTLQVTKAYFTQNSSVTSFQVQGNAVTGTLRLVTVTNSFVDIPGAVEWSDNGGVKQFIGFIPSPSLTSFNLNIYGGANYVIDNTRNFVLVFNSSNQTFTNGGSITGNSSNPINALNDYLTAFNAARPTGPVTVATQTTSSTTPTITGTATLASGESLSIELNGVVYTTSTGVSISGTTWSFTVPTALYAGTYNIVATITNTGGYTLSDTSTGELVISSVNFAGLGCITIVASGGDAENSTWSYANNTITPTSATNVSLNVADVLAKMALGNLKIESSCITVSGAVAYTGTGTPGLTLGRVGSTTTLVINAALSTKGSIVSYSDLITTNANLTTSSAATISLLGNSGLRFGNAGITLQSAGGDLILSSDYDANSLGNIIAEGALTLTSNGGAIRLGGGPAATNFAYGLGTSSTLLNDQTAGIWIRGAVAINSGNGDISIKGYAANASPTVQSVPTWGIGLGTGTTTSGSASVSLTSGTGKILVEGWARNPSGSNSNSSGVIFNGWDNSGTQPLTISSASTASDAIQILGNTENTINGQRYKNSLRFFSNASSITATGTGGGITLSGKTFDGNDHPQIGWGGGNILATSGPITINSENEALLLEQDMYVGSRAGTAITTSSSPIRFSIDDYSVASGKMARVASTGTLVIESFGNSFTDYTGTNTVLAFTTATGWSLNENSQTLTGLTIGKAATTSAITLGTATTVDGPVSVYGGDITIDGNINTSSGNANGDVVLKAIGAITQNSAKSLTTNGGDVIYWADADGNDAGDIFFGASSSYTDPASIQTGGGHIWLGGGSGSTTWNGLTVGDGYAVGASTRTVGGSFTHTNGITIQSTILNSGGGDIYLKGKGKPGNSPSAYSGGMYLLGSGAMNSDGGDITIEAFSNTGSGNKYGLYNLGAYTFAPGSGDLTITGDASASSADSGNAFTGRGIFLWSSMSPIVSTGNITMTGVKSSATGTHGIDIRTAITTTGGNLSLNAESLSLASALSASGTVTLTSTSALTYTQPITANLLNLLGSGAAYSLTDPANNVARLTGNTGAINYVDANALTLGPITSTGEVQISTQSGDLTLDGNLATSSTTTSAVVLNAGKTAAIGTTTGGNILVTGTPTLTTGTGGIVKLFSGSDAGSTGLTALAGGTANRRDGVDETTSTFSPALAAGNAYALYRQAVQLVAPNITSFTPTTAGTGESVVITGTGFTGVTVVKFGASNAASFTVNSDTQITAVVGAGSSGSVYVQNTAGNDSEAGFIYKVVELKFEGNTLDQTDANNDATLVGSATYGNGASGQAICFTNTNVVNGTSVQNYLRLPDNLIKGRGDNFTISLRFKTTGYGAILGYQNAGVGANSSEWVPILYVRSDGKLSANLWQGFILNVTSTNRVDDGNWHKVEFSAATGSLSVYIDGVLAGTSTGTTQHLSMSFNQLGAVKTTGVWDGDPIDGWFGFNGCIDEFIIVDKSLTSSQIQQVTQLPQPTVTSFAPTTAKSGETVTITGTNLSGTSAVKLGGVAARSFTIVSATEIRAIVGKDATLSTDVEVTSAAGTVTGSTFTFDCGNNSLAFDGSNDYVSLPNLTTGLSSFTFEAWVNPTTVTNWQRVFDFGTGDRNYMFLTTQSNAGTPRFGIKRTTSSEVAVSSSVAITAAKWAHLAVTLDAAADQAKIYVNGVLTGTASITLSPADLGTMTSHFLGRSLFSADPYFNGLLDEVKLWSSVRTAQQILAGMNAELIGNESGLVAYYNFNQGTPAGSNTGLTILNNLTATASLNGTLTNFALSGSSSNFVGGILPVITTQPATSSSVCAGSGSLTVSAVGSQLAYQWYSNTSATNSGGTAISGATAATLTIPSTATGTNYYYVVVSGACSQSVTSTVSTVIVIASPTITYSAAYSFERTFAITAATPTVSGGTITSYSISPALPTGLTLNTTTGVISGTPSAVSTSAIYTVTGTTASGCAGTTTFNLAVINAVAPSALSYSPATQTVRQGTAISAMTPTISGGAPTYTISPSLPAGLSINATTGVISGTLTAAQTGTVTYTITATNSGGSTTATVSLVFNTAPTAIALAPAAVAENAASGTTVGTLSATDADTGDTFTYALVSGTGSTDNASFTIDGTSLKTAAVFDFETKASYSIRVRVTDAGGLTFEQALTIAVMDVNEDRDGDGVKDDEERADGTDPLDACSFKLASQNATPSDAWKASDCDNDGLTNQREKDLGTDPLKADTDGDGVPDGVEVTDGTDPLDATKYKDTDGDLVPDFVETAEGTATGDSLKYKDSDKDGVPDYIELRDGTNPNSATSFKDTDGGGVPDYVEVTLFPNMGLAPANPNVRGDDTRDTDGDGVPDYQEFLEGTDPKDPSSFLDSDGDGVPNHVERIDGTDPNNSKEFKSSNGDGVADYIRQRSIQLSVLEEVVLAWGTKNPVSFLPKEVEVGIFSGLKTKFQVVWNKTETLNILKRGTYELTGTLVLPKGYYNPYKINGQVRVIVLPKPTPQDVTITNTTFVGSTTQFFISVGDFVVSDPVDNIHVVSLLGDGYDNKYFEVKSNILFWSSADRAPGKTTFSIVVRVTDRDGNTLDKFFTINRTRPAFDNLTIYNTFTPNADRFNDTWGVPEIRFYEGVRISVYERGGARVFFTENPDIRWDGTYEGKEMPVGSYYWVIQIDETGATRRGIVNLLR